MAGVNFVLYYRMITGRVGSVFRNTELKTYLAIFVIAMGIIAIDLFRTGAYPTFGESLRYAGFQASSILTTTGYATADFDVWPHLSKIVLFILMFIGAVPVLPAAASRWSGW